MADYTERGYMPYGENDDEEEQRRIDEQNRQKAANSPQPTDPFGSEPPAYKPQAGTPGGAPDKYASAQQPQQTSYDPTGQNGGNSGYAGPQQPVPANPAQSVKLNTDGYATPGYIAQNVGTAPPGYDQAKWNDPAHQTPKYAIAKIMQEASGGTGNLADPAKRQLAIERIQQAYPGATFDGKDKITMPDGGVVDVFGGAGAGQYTIAWMPVTGPGGAPLPGDNRGPGMPQPFTIDNGGVGGLIPPGGPLGNGGAGGPGPTGAGTGARGANWQALYDELVKRSQQGLDVDPNDPIIKNQVDAATAQANREALKQQQVAAARGGPYAAGAAANTARASNEAVQLQTSAMQAELMSREVAARRQEIAQALSGRMGMLTAEEQSRLRELDQQLQREEMALSDKHAMAQLALARENAQQNWGQMAWERMFKDRGWESDLAQTNYENERNLWY